MESIYWVLSRECNQRCPHCYNNSEPGAAGLYPQEVDACVAHLPSPDDVPVGRIILSGGEVLVWPELLFHTLRRLHARFGESTQLTVQTNGDLLDEALLDRLLEESVCRNRRVQHGSLPSPEHPPPTKAPHEPVHLPGNDPR